MARQVVRYAVDENTVARFEVEPGDDWEDVGAERVLGQVSDAVKPAVDAAKAVLDRAKDLAPDKVEVKFAIKVSGTANWIVAKAATEGNFEVTLTWDPRNPV